MKTVYDALDPIVNGPATTKEKGDKYEAACVHHLKNDPFYVLFFSRVGTIAQALERAGRGAARLVRPLWHRVRDSPRCDVRCHRLPGNIQKADGRIRST